MSSPTPPTGPKKALSTEIRMVMAFVLMGLIIASTPAIEKMLGIAPPPGAPVKDAKKIEATAPAASGAPMAPSSGAPSATPSSTTTTGAIAATSEQDQAIDTSEYHVVFSNRGAVVKSWTLKNYKDAAGKPLELVNGVGANKVSAWPFSFIFRTKGPSTDLNKALWVGHSDGATIRYEFSDGTTYASKTFAFQQDGSMVQYSDDVSLNGAGLAHQAQWRGGFGDMAVQNAYSQQATIRYNIDKQKLERDAAKSAKGGPVYSDGSFSFAGIDDQYFAAAFLPSPNTSLETTTFDDVVATKFNNSEEAYPGVAIGGAAKNQFGIYIGPKEINALHRVNPKLDGIVDWGFFGVIAKPLFIVLHWENDQFVHNYGWSIILLTVFINFALFPLKLSSLKSGRKMQLLQPEMNAINAKYKGLSMTDPKAANKQQEIMDLYKKNGINPMGGCLPLLIQMPFLWAFYKVLSVTIEMRHASFLWVTDLSQPEHLELKVLPLIMVVTSFLMMSITPAQPGQDPSQKRMMQIMPLMYLFFFWNQSSGLVLYWLTGNIVGIAQQWFFNKTNVPVAAPPSPKMIAKDGRKRA